MVEYVKGTFSVCLVALLFILPGLACAQQLYGNSEQLPERGPWVPERQPATAKEERQIVEGCALKAELVFYAAQEKLYNHGSTEKLMAYMRDNMSQAEYVVQHDLMQWVGEWVDSNDHKTAHEHARVLFYECVSNSYQHFDRAPTDRAAGFMRAFEEQLDATEELPIPANGREVEA